MSLSITRGMYSHCSAGGWVLGNEIDGTQAESVRTPHADTGSVRFWKVRKKKLSVDCCMRR